MTIPFINPFIQKVRRHPQWLGLAVIVGLGLWVGWLGYAHVISPAPTEADIAQQTVRFNEAGFAKVSSLNARYHQPIELPDFKRNPFTATP